MGKNRKAKNTPEKRSHHNLQERGGWIASVEDVHGKLSRAESLVEISNALGDVLKFVGSTDLRKRERIEITDASHQAAEKLLRAEITSEKERDALPYLAGNLGQVSQIASDYSAKGQKAYARMEKYLNRFVKLLDEADLFRVMAGFSQGAQVVSPAFFDKLSAHFIKLAGENRFDAHSLINVPQFFAEAKYQPSPEVFQAWDETLERLKRDSEEQEIGEEWALPTSEVAMGLYHLTLMKVQGLKVPQELVEKWFDYAANKRDGSFDHRSWRQMYLTAMIFDFPNPERFKMSAISQSKSDSRAQSYYRKQLEKNARLYTQYNQRGIEIKVEHEQIFPALDSTVDYKVTISGGEGAGDRKTVFWVQYDGPYHFSHTGGTRDYSASTKLQNMIVDSHLPEAEHFSRVDYLEVRKAGLEAGDVKQGSFLHTKALVTKLVQEHEHIMAQNPNQNSRNGEGWQR